jgi:hypothetical protein
MRVIFVIAAILGLTMPSSALAQADAAHSEAGAASSPTLKTIVVGGYTSHYAMFDALDASGIQVGDRAAEILHRPAFTISKTKTSTQLVVATARELGFEERVSLAEVYARALKLGYELCPPEVAVSLRLQYRDQPIGEFLTIAMEPIATYVGEPVGLSVGNGGAGLVIVGQTMARDTLTDRDTRFVFIHPLKIARSVP